MIVPGGVDRTGEYRVIPALLALIERLARQHDVHVFALRQEPRAATWPLRGARIYNIGHGATRLRAIRRICAQHRATPFDLVQAIWSGACGFIAVTAARILRLPSLVHVAGGELVRIPEIGFGGRLGWRGRLQESVVRKGATVMTAASAGMLHALDTFGRSAQRVPLGADLRTWVPRAPARRAPPDSLRLIHVASLNRVKDQVTLLRALRELAARHVEFQLELVGEDTLDGEIQRLAHEWGLAARIRFHGFMPQPRLVEIMRTAHLHLVSSRHEAGPLVVLEAAALGVPTVGTAVGHVAEFSPEAALAVPIGDPAALAAAIGAIAADEELRLRLAHNALARTLREDADYTARCFEDLYAHVVHR